MNEIFSADGRYNRARYFGYSIALSVTTGLFQLLLGDSGNMFALLLLFPMMLISFYINACITVKRFHDLDRPGIHFLLLFIPIYNIYLHLVLLFKRGTDGPNQYGEDPLMYL